MPMRESSGPEGGYGVRPANPEGKMIRTGGQTEPVTKPPVLSTQISHRPVVRVRRGRR